MLLHHIWILTTNYQIAKQSYIKDFWYTLKQEIHNKETGNTYCHLSKDDILPYIELLDLKDNIYDLPTHHIAYQVEDINQEYYRLVDLWYKEVCKPSNGSIVRQMAFLRTPDMHTYIELITL